MPVERAVQILGENAVVHARLVFDTVDWVESDKINRCKAHKYPTVFGDLLTKRVLSATHSKAASVWVASTAELLRHGDHPKTVQHVAIEISAAYIKGVSDKFGNSRVVYDKFHVIQNEVKAGDQVREVESRADGGQRDRSEWIRWISLKNRVNWTVKEAQKWESMALNKCLTGSANQMTLMLQGIYE